MARYRGLYKAFFDIKKVKYRVYPGDQDYMRHMLRHVAKCRRRTKDIPDKPGMPGFRMYEWKGLYPRLIEATNRWQIPKLHK